MMPASLTSNGSTPEGCKEISRGYRSLRSLNPRLISLHASGVLNGTE
jgi:hypothetical protein